MFAALAKYRRLHGDFLTCRTVVENPVLAKWVKGLRAAQKRGDMDGERFSRLDSIGFEWDRGGDSRWDEMINVY